MINPLFGGLTEIEVLARILGESETDSHVLVQSTIGKLTDGSSTAFDRFLHDGILADSSYPRVPV